MQQDLEFIRSRASDDAYLRFEACYMGMHLDSDFATSEQSPAVRLAEMLGVKRVTGYGSLLHGSDRGDGWTMKDWRGREIHGPEAPVITLELEKE